MLGHWRQPCAATGLGRPLPRLLAVASVAVALTCGWRGWPAASAFSGAPPQPSRAAPTVVWARPTALRAAGSCHGVARSSEGPAERVGELLLDAARLAPCRFVVIGPTIMEATADLRVGQAQVRVSPRPGGGGPLLTLAAPDKSFEVHVDASAVAEATLGVSETTGKGVLRLLSAEKRLLLTVIPVGEDAQTHFDVLFGRWGASVRFQD
mmetsp:Transcript_64833/g.193197  ORF Transcript_64833/g.193197 Transcript_64833/m.193197 type:complete len:209 (+) Transcript_64833:72-698(+)